jgi:hypothetical protein
MEERNIDDDGLGAGLPPQPVQDDELQLAGLISSINAKAYGEMKVCGSCGYLKGSLPQTAEEPEVHLCGCVPQEERRAQPRWGNKDFNQELELCYCCGAVEIRSGSKWASFFCGPCHRRIGRLNRSVGRCVIPIGRHSLMNRVIAPEPMDEVSVIAFVDQLGGFFKAVTFVDDWSGIVALRNLALCGYPKGVDAALGEYLDRALKHAPSPSEAFESLVRAVATPKEVTP